MGLIRTKKNMLVIPIVLVVIGVLLTLLQLTMLIGPPPGIAITALLATAAVAIIGLVFYRWLDRWEPEPPILFVAAFVWGAGVATFFGGIGNGITAALFGEGVAVVFSAPFGEEALKAAFLGIVLLSKRGRSELNSLTDLLVYAGTVGLGFTFIEDIQYITEATNGEELGVLLFVRIGLGAFGHSMYQSIFAIGLWFGLRRGGAGSILGFGFLGYLGAVLLHMLHNGSSLFGIGALVIVLLLELALFIGGMIYAIRTSIGERKNLERQLPAMIHQGWLSPSDGGWLLNTAARKQVLARAGANQAILKDFIQNATELAHLRTRLDQHPGQAPNDLLAQHQHLAQLLMEQRPVVDGTLQGAQQQVPGGWASVPAQPGQQWGPPGSR